MRVEFIAKFSYSFYRSSACVDWHVALVKQNLTGGMSLPRCVLTQQLQSAYDPTLNQH